MCSTKTCSLCNKKQQLDNFYSNGYAPSGAKKYKSRCKSCTTKIEQERFVEKIEEALSYLGKDFSCENCGYNKNTAALCFHHIDPKEKDKEISSMKTHSVMRIFEEISKCVVLCHNCHMEEHYPHLTR